MMINAAFSRSLIEQREQELRALADFEHTMASARARRRRENRARRISIPHQRRAPAGGCAEDLG